MLWLIGTGLEQLGLHKKILSHTWLDKACPAHLYLGWGKIKSPFDIDLQDKDL